MLIEHSTEKDLQKDKHCKFWENLQLFSLGLTICGQILVGASFLIGQILWLVANCVSLVRDFVLKRPIADKIKDASLTAITLGLIVLGMLGLF